MNPFTHPTYEPAVLGVLADGPHPTPEIADRLAEDERTTYRHCRRLQDMGELRSRLQGTGETLHFCKRCGRVLTQETYRRHLRHEIRSFAIKVRYWELTDAGRQRLH